MAGAVVYQCAAGPAVFVPVAAAPARACGVVIADAAASTATAGTGVVATLGAGTAACRVRFVLEIERSCAVGTVYPHLMPGAAIGRIAIIPAAAGTGAGAEGAVRQRHDAVGILRTDGPVVRRPVVERDAQNGALLIRNHIDVCLCLLSRVERTRRDGKRRLVLIIEKDVRQSTAPGKGIRADDRRGIGDLRHGERRAAGEPVREAGNGQRLHILIPDLGDLRPYRSPRLVIHGGKCGTTPGAGDHQPAVFVEFPVDLTARDPAGACRGLHRSIFRKSFCRSVEFFCCV